MHVTSARRGTDKPVANTIYELKTLFAVFRKDR